MGKGTVSAMLCVTMLGMLAQTVQSAPEHDDQGTVQAILGLERAYRFTRVYVKQHGSWKTVALQTTLENP